MSLDRADRSFIRRAIADAVDKIVEAVAGDAADVSDGTPDADDDDGSDDGRIAVPTHAVADVQRLARGTRCVIVGGVTSLRGDTVQGFGWFVLRDGFDSQTYVHVAVPTRYSAEFVRHVRDGAVVAVDGIVERATSARVTAMIIRVLAAPPPQAAPDPVVVPAPALPSTKPSAPPCWPLPAVIGCRVGCGSDAPQWERRPAPAYYAYALDSHVYAQCALHGNWLQINDRMVQRVNISVYSIGAPPAPAATRLRCDICGPLRDTWLVAEDADGRPRLYCGGTTFVDGEHRPLHAYRVGISASGDAALVCIPHPGAVAQVTQAAPDA